METYYNIVLLAANVYALSVSSFIIDLTWKSMCPSVIPSFLVRPNITDMLLYFGEITEKTGNCSSSSTEAPGLSDDGVGLSKIAI
jgi:hypothetical protein